MNKNFVIVDGNEAAAQAAYEFTEIAAIYPITPSSPMATQTDVWSARGRKNMFGQPVRLVEMQSEAGAIGAVHGALQAGTLTTTFTSSQGLMLMIPTLYRIVGEHLPAVLHVAARTVGTHAMSIFGDHSDVMACRQTGVAMLCSGSVQECADLAAAAHLSAVKGRVPFMHFFDGFRTSHELSRVELPDPKALSALIDTDALDDFRARALNPEHPMIRNMVQNGDVYFQMREASNPFYDALPGIVEDYMGKISAVTGRECHIMDYYGAPDAEHVIVAMGSVSGTIREVVDYLNKRGKKLGFIQIRLYRPFDAEYFCRLLPETVRRIAVLDRCKEMGNGGEPLFQDVCTALMNSNRSIKTVGGRYGLSSKDVDPSQILAVFENLEAETPKSNFTVGITDDVTFRSLAPSTVIDTTNADCISCKFWGLGGDGTVGANHETVKILGDYKQLYAQAYFEYDAKKSFGTTKSHLRFSSSPIRGSYFVKNADFAACHNPGFITQYEDIVKEIKPGGTLLLNTSWTEEELDGKLPALVKKLLAEKKIRLCIIDATHLAEQLGLGSHTNILLQSAFFCLAGFMPREEAMDILKDTVRKKYGAKGETVVEKNLKAVDAGAYGFTIVTVPEAWAASEIPAPTVDESLPYAVRQFLAPINAQQGDRLPVSAFKGYEDGVMDPGLTAFEKRGIAVNIPQWNAQACLQCNLCSLVCPHAVIRPYLVSEEEQKAAPESFETVPAKGADGFGFRMEISARDCTGCGSCVSVCPAASKGALTMVPAEFTAEKDACWQYGLELSDKDVPFDTYTVKGSQFRRPLIEFSAACAGCGETPYAKLLTQLFGTRVYWANGTGCSQAWGSPTPGIPYTTNKRGFGPAYTNSLFENNAELMLGIYLSSSQQRAAQKMRVEALLETQIPTPLRSTAEEWLRTFDDTDASRKSSDALIAELEKENSAAAAEILKARDQLAKKSFWMYGGDGWAYDIGFGGLDHVLASGENINVFVIDTEVYSNTGGQASKATPIGAVAQFAASGKKTRKKDLGAIMMSYGNIYVAQVAMGANPAQLIKALKEAEAYPGPSLVVAYTPCQAHGIKKGMSRTMEESRRAVESGYWNLYRYDPRVGRLKLDSPEPKMALEDFLEGELRYHTLTETFPENARTLFAQAAQEARERYAHYRELEERGT